MVFPSSKKAHSTITRLILNFALFVTVASTVGVPESLYTRSIDNSIRDEKSSDDIAMVLI